MDGPRSAPFRRSRGDQALSRANALTIGSAGFVLGAFASFSGLSTGLFAALASSIAISSFPPRRAFIAIIAGCAVLSGCLYAAAFRRATAPEWRPDARGMVEGVVVSDPAIAERSQHFRISLRNPARGRSEVIAIRFPEAAYGDRIRITAADLRPAGDSEDLSAPVLVGTVAIVGHEEGSRARAWLLAAKRHVLAGFRERLPFDAAALLGGLLLGDRASFSPELSEAMRRSGTTHLVAISGYNIGLVALGIGSVCRRFLARRAAFAVTAGAIAAFTVMVGAEASVVRAAIMGTLFLFSRLSGREASVWRMMALAAAAMTLADPGLPRFDLGFQLSFVSLAGLVLLEPAFRHILRAHQTSSFLGWREALAASAAAQAMVMPLLMHAFDEASLIALPANVAILPAVPPVMFLGSLAAALDMAAPRLATVTLWSAYGFLSYMLSGIERFGALAGGFMVPFPGPWFAAIYYLGLFLFALRFRDRTISHPPQ